MPRWRTEIVLEVKSKEKSLSALNSLNFRTDARRVYKTLQIGSQVICDFRRLDSGLVIPFLFVTASASLFSDEDETAVRVVDMELSHAIRSIE